MSELCENCGRSIGKLETPRVHKGKIVCTDCDQKLKAEIPDSPEWAVPEIPKSLLAENAPAIQYESVATKATATARVAGECDLCVGRMATRSYEGKSVCDRCFWENFRDHVPTYAFLQLGGYVCLLIGLGAIVAGGAIFVNERGIEGPCIAAAGVLYACLGEAFVALRHIACNSWKI